MFIYIHIISYYKLFLYFYLCLSVMLDSLSCYIHIISYYKLFLYFTLCHVGYSLMFIYIHYFLLQAVPLLYFVSKCNVRYSLMFIYIHIISYYKLFLYYTLCLSVMLDTLSCSYTSISFLTTSCSFTLLCV